MHNSIAVGQLTHQCLDDAGHVKHTRSPKLCPDHIGVDASHGSKPAMRDAAASLGTGRARDPGHRQIVSRHPGHQRIVLSLQAPATTRPAILSPEQRVRTAGQQAGGARGRCVAEHLGARGVQAQRLPAPVTPCWDRAGLPNSRRRPSPEIGVSRPLPHTGVHAIMHSESANVRRSACPEAVYKRVKH